MDGSRSSSSSSGEEDGDAEWRAAIDSVTSSATVIKHNSSSSRGREIYDDQNHKPQNIKHYQIKAQTLLDDILDKTIEVVTDTNHLLDKDPEISDGGVRLFKHAPIGIVFDHLDELHGPKKKPKIVPGEELDEKSKKFKRQLQHASINGVDIIAGPIDAAQKSLAKVEAREEAAKARAKGEEERLAKLKKIRGERWLPSVARQMRVNTQCRR